MLVGGEYKCPPEPASRPDWPRGDLSLFEFYPHKLLPRTVLSTHTVLSWYSTHKRLCKSRWNTKMVHDKKPHIRYRYCFFQLSRNSTVKPQRSDPPSAYSHVTSSAIGHFVNLSLCLCTLDHTKQRYQQPPWYTHPFLYRCTVSSCWFGSQLAASLENT